VKIKGEDGQNREDTDSFASKKPWQRIVVLVAGVVMNFLLAAALLGIGFMFGLPQALDGVRGGEVSDQKIQIISTLPGLPAEEAGVQYGDVVVSFNGEAIDSVDELIQLTDAAKDTTATIELLRGDERVVLDVPVVAIEGDRGGIGIHLLETGIVKYPFFTSLYKGFEAAVLITLSIVVGFGQIIGSIFSGNGVGASVSGPVGIAVMTGQVASLGISYLLQFTALLSLNLAVLNILPFPALDGGRIIFVLIEKIRNKPVSQKIEGYFHAAGFLLLMLLILVVTFKDIFSIFK
jgi:regulator of sigma E protease